MFLNQFSSRNGWYIIGSDIKASSKCSLESVTKKSVPTILVVGNEGRGMRQTVSAACDQHIIIKSMQESKYLDSLNVSVATGILLNALATGRN